MTPRLPNGRKNAAFAVIEFGVGAAVAFFGYKLVLDAGGPALLGLWATLFAAVSLFRVGEMGLGIATMRCVAAETNHPDRLICTAAALGSVSYALVSLLGWWALDAALVWLVPDTHLPLARNILPLLVVALYLFHVSNIVLGALQGLQAGYLRSALATATFLLQLILSVLLVPLLGLVGFAIAQVVQYAVLLIAGWTFVRRCARMRVLLPIGMDLPALRKLLGLGLRTQAASVTAGLVEPAAKLVVGSVAGLHVQGVFELAYKTCWVARNFALAAANAAVPGFTAMAVGETSLLPTVYDRVRRQASLAALGALTLALVASPLLSLHWLGGVDWEYCQFVAVLAVGMLFSATAAPAYSLAIVFATQRHNVAINLATVVGVGLAGLVAPPAAVVPSISATLVGAAIVTRLFNEPLMAVHHARVEPSR